MNNDPVETYLVGGAVRDELLGIPVKEKDWVVVGSTPEAMVDKGFRPVGQSFPVFIHSQSGEEYALARTERKTGRGYKGFSFFTDPSVTLEQDLLRRDLSINAIAMRDNGELIDPLGGRGDIERRVLRHVSDAFLEDPLRVLRVARFVAQLAEFDFTIASETLELMEKMVESGELEDLTAERVWIETEKALQTVRPRLYFETLRKMGALKVLFPEIDRLFGVPQNPKYHPEIDTGLHILLSLDQICAESNVLRLRFSVLVHDLGKGTTPRDQWPSHNGHEERGVKQIENLAKRLRIPNDCRDLAIKVSRWHLHCHRALELKAATIEKLFSGLDLWRNPQLLPEFLSCCQADIRGRTGMENNDYPQAAYLTDCFQAALTVDSQKIRESGFEGEAIGKKMREARIAAIQDAKERRAS